MPAKQQTPIRKQKSKPFQSKIMNNNRKNGIVKVAEYDGSGTHEEYAGYVTSVLEQVVDASLPCLNDSADMKKIMEQGQAEIVSHLGMDSLAIQEKMIDVAELYNVDMNSSSAFGQCNIAYQLALANAIVSHIKSNPEILS